MKRDNRLCSILHILLHMADHPEPLPSERLATFLNTNPVVVRRTMAGLRAAGLVRSAKGHGGGWTLVRDLSTVTLRDVYAALGAPPFFAMGNRSEAPRCLVERAVNASLDEVFHDAEAMLLARLNSVTLADITKDLKQRTREHSETHHAV
jgi:Rrf2 family protein